jgi:hypothetical protein
VTPSTAGASVSSPASAQAPAGTVGAVRRLLSPGWISLHITVAIISAVMLWLGAWQWSGGFQGHHTMRNLGYALQWWIFVVFGVYFWLRLMRDALRKAAPGADGYVAGGPATAPAPLLRRPKPPVVRPEMPVAGYVMASAATVADDSDLGRYNAYLASLDHVGDPAPAAPLDQPAPLDQHDRIQETT